MSDKNSVLYILFAERFLGSIANKEITKLTQNKVDKFKEEITPLINDEKIV